MKRIITLSIALLISSIGFSQNAPITFETGAHGNTWTWTTFENGTNPPPAQVVANPSATGINTSATVLRMTMQQSGQQWAGVETSHGAGIGTFTLSAANAIVKIMVYKPVISDVGIKFATSTNGSTGEIKVPNTVINQWEELTFDFSSKIGEVNDQIIIFLDFQARTTNNICYFDNISFSAANLTPAIPAPIPTKPSTDVISMFSNTYTNVLVDTWRTSWSNATLTDLQIQGNDTKRYSALDFVGIEFVGPKMINADSMQTLNMDIWTTNVTTFKVKLVDFGSDGVFGGGNDTEHELTFTPTAGSWNTLNIPLTNFTGLTSRAHLAQMILVGQPTGTGTIFIDNVYFAKTTTLPTTPTVAAPTPTKAASDVKSMFSNAYTNVAVDTWRTSWSSATLTDLQIQGNDTKKYSALDFVGIEFVGPNMINADTMQTLNMDIWTSNVTTFKVKLVDFGSDGAFGGGNDTEHELTFTPTAGSWNTLNIPLANFTGLASRAHLAQMILVGQPTGTGTIFIDNIYFAKTTVLPTEPTVAAPTPTKAASDVKSMFSNAYTNLAIDTWRTSWSSATLTDLQIQGNDTKKYSALDFVGIEFVGPNMINADTMQTLNMDIWTSNVTTFKVKLVDFGSDGAFGGGNDTEHELTFTPTAGSWNTLNIPLANFTGLGSRAHLAQMILVGQPTGTGTIFVDNIYFAKTTVVATEPTVAAPTPTKPANDVISMFSNAYTNVAVDTWRTSWSSATLTDVQVQGNDTKKYASLDFVGIETTGANLIDASTMSNFHMDVWTADATTFRIKLVDFGANAAFGGGDDTEHELIFTPTLNSWNSFNIPLTDFINLTNKSHIAQLILSAVPAGGANVFIDNIYFSRATVLLEPTIAAPTPKTAAVNVISMFSNAYTNVAVDTWRTPWSSAVLTEMQVAGNDVKKYSALDFVGIETTGANLINATSMDTFHVDMWTPNITTFRVKLVDFGNDAAFGGGDDTEHELLFTPVLNEWNSLHIPLSAFTGLTARGHVAQLILSALPTALGTVYIDNVHFSKKPVVGIDAKNNNTLNVYPNPTSDKLFIEGLNANESNTVKVYDIQGKLVEELKLNSDNTINISNLDKGIYLVKIANKVARVVKM